MAKDEAYYQGCNQHLLRAVPPSALRILEVGCAEGRFGAALKQQNPRRVVHGIERESSIAARAAQRLDRVLSIDIEREDVDAESGAFDCITYGDVLEHLVDPWSVLRRHRRLLAAGGVVLCSVPNIQHHSILKALLQGDFQYAPSGLLDTTHLRFFTYSTFTKLLLDAGFEPSIVDVIEVPAGRKLLSAAQPLLRLVGADSDRSRRYLNAHQYIFRAKPLDDPGEGEETPITVVACVSDDARMSANLLASPCLVPESRHEVMLMKGRRSAAEAYNEAIERSKNDIVVFVHQDVYLPRGWPKRLVRSMARADETFGNVGIYGVYGASAGQAHAGYVVDRDMLMHPAPSLPAQVDTLDELLLVIHKPTPLRFDEQLGFHLYGADICLAARAAGLRAVAIDALCFHNSLTAGLPAQFFRSGRVFANKLAARLPVSTACAEITPSWTRWPLQLERLTSALRDDLHKVRVWIGR